MNQRKRGSTVVLVTDQFACERIIKAARVVANLNKTELLVLSIQRPGVCANPQAVEHLFAVAKEYDAQMTVVFSGDVLGAILKFCRENRAVSVVTGIPEGKSSVLSRLWQRMASVEFFTVSSEGQLQEVFDRRHHRELVRMATNLEREQLA